MRPLDLNIQHRLMKISIPPRLLQHLNLIILQSPPSLVFQFLPTDLRADFLSFLVLVLRLEACLHAQTNFCRRRDFVGVTTNGRRCCISVDAEVCVAHGAESEETRLGFGGEAFECFFGRDGFAGRGEGADAVAAKVSVEEIVRPAYKDSIQ